MVLLVFADYPYCQYSLVPDSTCAFRTMGFGYWELCPFSTRDLFWCSSSCSRMHIFSQHLLWLHFCWLLNGCHDSRKILFIRENVCDAFLQPSMRHLVYPDKLLGAFLSLIGVIFPWRGKYGQKPNFDALEESAIPHCQGSLGKQ